MTINTENPSRMILHDNKQTAFLAAGACAGIGLLIVCSCLRFGVFPLFIGLAFMGVGALILFNTKRVTIELDKTAGTIHILLQGIKSKSERSLAIAQVQKLFLRKMIQTHTMRQNQRIGGDIRRTSSSTTYHQFYLVFVTGQNEEIPFQFGRVKVGLMNVVTNPEEKIRGNAQQVANFLNVPLEQVNPPSALAALGAIRSGLAGTFQKAH